MMVGSVERGQLVNKLVGGQVRCRYTYDWRHRNAMRWHIIAPHKWREACRELQVNGRPVGSTGAISAQEGGKIDR